MAEEKAKEKEKGVFSLKEKQSAGGAFGEIFGVIVFIFLIVTVLSAIIPDVGEGLWGEIWDRILSFLSHIFSYIQIISIILSVIAIILIIILNKKNSKIYKLDSNLIEKYAKKGEIPSAIKEKQIKSWQSIQEYMSSSNPNDWRAAILKADIILDDLLSNLGYSGESLGDKLKQISKSEFRTIEDAWEAHKVRNTIAHEGEVVLSKNEAQKAINSYERVFKEFDFI